MKFFNAISDNNIKEVKQLLQNKVDVNKRDPWDTALIIASQKNYKCIKISNYMFFFSMSVNVSLDDEGKEAKYIYCKIMHPLFFFLFEIYTFSLHNAE